MALFGPSKREQELQAEINRLRSMLSPQQQNAMALDYQIRNLNAQQMQIGQQIAGQQ